MPKLADNWASSLSNVLTQTSVAIARGAAESKANGQNLDELYRAAAMETASATDSLMRGETLAGMKRMQTTQLLGKQRVAYNNSGVDSTVGTPADVQAATGTIGELEAMQLSNNAVREAWGHKEAGRKYSLQAEKLRKKLAMQPFEIAGQVLAAVGGAAATVLTGGAAAAGIVAGLAGAGLAAGAQAAGD